jgi:hypothetical protein
VTPGVGSGNIIAAVLIVLTIEVIAFRLLYVLLTA